MEYLAYIGKRKYLCTVFFLGILESIPMLSFNLRIKIYNMLADMQFITFDKFHGTQIVYQYAWESTACIYKSLV